MSFAAWRIVHRVATAFIGVMGLLHASFTFTMYDGWGPDALWFMGTGLSLVFLAVINWAHVGTEPCTMPTAPVVRHANVAYALFGFAAVLAVPQQHAWLLAAALLMQAVAGLFTLAGPERRGRGQPPSDLTR
jgi:hypothetical protein